MSLVTRGLSRPIALLPTLGLGVGTSVIIVIDLEQATLALEMLQDAGIADTEIQIETVEAQSIQLAIIVAQDPEGMLDEYLLEHTVSTPLQRVTVTDRPINIEVKTVTVEMGMVIANNPTGFLEIYLQEAGIDEIKIEVDVVDSKTLTIGTVAATDPTGVIDEYTQDVEHVQSIDKNEPV